MNNDDQVSGGRPPQIHMGTSTENSDAVTKNVGYSPWRLERITSGWSASNQLHRLGLTRRKLKKIVCGHSHTSYWMLHVAYYAALTVTGTIFLWWCRGTETISFVDCIFNAVSALTSTGLSSVLLRDFTPLGKFVLMVLMLLGHTVFVSLLPVYVRRFQFYCHHKARLPHMTTHGAADITAITKKASSTNGNAMDISRIDQVLEVRTTGDGQEHGQIDGFGIRPEIKSEKLRGNIAICCERARQDRLTPHADHDSELLECQAVATLSWLVPIYMIVFLTFGFVAVFCYTSFSSKGSSKVRGLYKAEGINPMFTAMFLSISAFSNTGLSPLDDNMVPFAAAPLVLVPLAALILAGNCMFPPILRCIIWGLSILERRTGDPQRMNVYEYLLQFPRRCYTHLFPRMETTWLVATMVAFNVVDLIAFCALEWNSTVAVTEDSENAGIKLMDGLFQSINTRSAGMNVLQLSTLSPPMLILYTAVMSIAAYPVFLSRQQSRLTRPDVNLHPDCNTCVSEKSASTESAADKSLSLQFRNLFTKDSAGIFVHVFLICTVEIGSINSDPLNYTIFSIVFEVISAYANVGLSLGYRCQQWVRASANTPQAQAAAACAEVAYSFSGKWRAGSKLVLVGAMLMGRHRSLPDDMDSAIAMAPSFCNKSCSRTVNRNCSDC